MLNTLGPPPPWDGDVAVAVADVCKYDSTLLYNNYSAVDIVFLLGTAKLHLSQGILSRVRVCGSC